LPIVEHPDRTVDPEHTDAGVLALHAKLRAQIVPGAPLNTHEAYDHHTQTRSPTPFIETPFIETTANGADRPDEKVIITRFQYSL